MLTQNSTIRARLPYGLITVVLLIIAIGILNLSSAAKATQPNLYLIQLAWVGFSFCVAAVVVAVHTRRIKQIAYIFHALVCCLLLLVLVVGISAKGGQRWIDLGFFKLQPSELAKLSVGIALARYLSEYRRYKGYTLRDLLRPFNLSRPTLLFAVLVFILSFEDKHNKIPFIKDPTSTSAVLLMVGIVLVGFVWFLLAIHQIHKEGWHFAQWVSPIDVVAIPFLLIVVEPDLGTAMVVMAIASSLVLFSGLRTWSLIILLCVGFGLAAGAWHFALKDYQKQRVFTFLNPEADVRGHGYHSVQSIIAIGSGQFIGKGFGEGTQTQLSFLPENHTDFVFAVLAEEWGFLGVLVLLILYAFLIIQLIDVIPKLNDPFACYMVVGAASIVFWHVLVNTGMVTGMLPVVGVPLPLMSYGGSSMLTQMIAIALCVNVMVWRRVE